MACMGWHMTDTTMDKDAIMAMMQGFPVEYYKTFNENCVFLAPWGSLWVEYPALGGTCSLCAFYDDGGYYISLYMSFDKDTITNFLVKAELGARNDEDK